MGVFDDHNGIIDDNTQGHQQGKEYDHVHGEAQAGHEHKGQERRNRNRKSHKHGVGGSHKEHQNQGDQDKANNDGIGQVVHGGPRNTALIPGNCDLEVAW